jgi:hypothetical protein
MSQQDRRFSLSNYPLCWPEGWRRSGSLEIKSAQFKRNNSRPNVMEGLNRILTQLASMGIRKDDVLVSTNIPTRLDGMPRSDQREPVDHGIAVYWRKHQNAEMQCIAIDIYKTVADNLCACAATLEALRAIERHGGAQVQERTFRGFAALPSKAGSRPWREVLGVAGTNVTAAFIEDQFRSLARVRHPDVAGGSHDKMAELNQARAEALAEVGK